VLVGDGGRGGVCRNGATPRVSSTGRRGGVVGWAGGAGRGNAMDEVQGAPSPRSNCRRCQFGHLEAPFSCLSSHTRFGGFKTPLTPLPKPESNKLAPNGRLPWPPGSESRRAPSASLGARPAMRPALSRGAAAAPSIAALSASMLPSPAGGGMRAVLVPVRSAAAAAAAGLSSPPVVSLLVAAGCSMVDPGSNTPQEVCAYYDYYVLTSPRFSRSCFQDRFRRGPERNPSRGRGARVECSFVKRMYTPVPRARWRGTGE